MRKFTHVWESRTMALEGMPVNLGLVSVWTSEGSLRIGGCAEMKMGREGNEVNGLIKECFFLPQRYILTPCRFSVCLATTWWFFIAAPFVLFPPILRYVSRFITVFVFVFVFVFFVLNLEIAQQDLLKTVIYLDYSASSAPVVRFPNCHERLPEEGGLGWGTLQAVLLPCKAMLDTARYIHSNIALRLLYYKILKTHPKTGIYRHTAPTPFCCTGRQT